MDIFSEITIYAIILCATVAIGTVVTAAPVEIHPVVGNKPRINDITINVQLGATAVAMVGLLVGIIGVMNIMLVSVTQRTREIGVRKAVGAKRKNILFQFLVEAATLTGLGGIVGIIFGAGIGLLVTTILEWQYFLNPMWIAIALLLSAGTGIIAGLYPAWKASKVNPIVALMYE